MKHQHNTHRPSPSGPLLLAAVLGALAFSLGGVASAQDSDIIPIGKSYFWGSTDAPVTIVAFSEFQCPFCSRVVPTLQRVLADYEGDVRLVFKHLPLPFHKDADLAAQAALEAGEQGYFAEMHDVLFENQRALGRADLERYAQQLGLDMGRFRSALDTGKHSAEVKADAALAASVGARGTPNFFINGIRLNGAQPFEKFKGVIDAELKAARKAGGAKAYAARVKKNYEAPKPRPGAKPPAPSPSADTIYNIPVGKKPIYLGEPDAPVTILTYSEFQCPFCSRGSGTLKQLLERYPGKVRVVFKHFPLAFHKDAPLASVAALAAGEQGKFWEMHDLLFENQRALKRPQLEGYAEQLGLNMTKFKGALDKPGRFEKQIAADTEEGKKFGVRGTPAFFINGKRLAGAQPLEKFDEAYKDGLARANKARGKRKLKGDKLYALVVKKGKKSAADATPAAKAVDKGKPVKINTKGAPSRGPKRAKVTIVEFSDFQCPYCSRATSTLSKIEDVYGKKVKIVFMHQPLPFHKDAALAAEASMAANAQGKFWEYHDLLFANQRALSRDDLQGYAKQLGLDMKKFNADLDSGKYTKVVAAHKGEAAKVGATGTPTFFINGYKLVGAQPFERFEALIKEELEGKKGRKKR